MNAREAWTVIHGLVLGTLFLLAFTGGLAELWALRSGVSTAAGVRQRMRRLYLGAWVMAATSVATVFTGTWIVYPWYREELSPVRGEEEYVACEGQVLPGETCSPREFLLSDASGNTAAWHSFGMEWKEHVAWASPILAVAAAFLISYYGPRLIARPWLRAAVITMFVAAFAAAAVAGLFGAFLNKVAPIV